MTNLGQLDPSVPVPAAGVAAEMHSRVLVERISTVLAPGVSGWNLIAEDGVLHQVTGPSSLATFTYTVPRLFLWDPAWYARAGKTTKWTGVLDAVNNGTGAGVKLNCCLLPVTGASGGAGVVALTVLVAAPRLPDCEIAASSMVAGAGASSEVTVDAPTSGRYALAVSPGGGLAANSFVAVTMSLFVEWA